MSLLPNPWESLGEDPRSNRLGPRPETPEEAVEREEAVDSLVARVRAKRASLGTSEFGPILAEIHEGDVISAESLSKHEDGTVVFISSAFNPLTSVQLREIADLMDTWK